MSKTAEEEAIALGWQPKENWKGPENGWKDADTFMRDGEKMAGFVRKRLEKDFEERIKRIEQASGAALEFQQKQAEKERTALLADLKAQKAEAIEDNDLAKLEKVKEQIVEVQESAPDPKDVAAAAEFRSKHEFWQGKDWVLHNFADGAAGALSRRGLKGAELLTELDKQLRETFPEKFGKVKRGGAVEADSQNEVSGDEKTFSDLPKEAKSAYEQLAKRIKGFTKEQYAKDYYAQA
jgi:hypothetical protein